MLQTLHIIAACIHAISCGFSIWLHTDSVSSAITLPHHTYMITPKGVNATLTHVPVLYTNPMVWIAGNEGLTLFSHLIALVAMGLFDDKKIDLFERRRRTIEYSLTAGILQVALCLGIGSIALYDVFWLLGVNVAIQLLGWLGDDANERNWFYGIGFGLLSLEIFFVISQSVNLHGIDSGPYVFMGIAYGVFYLLFGAVKIIPLWRKNENKIYIIMSVTSKVALSWILIGNTFQGFKELGVKTQPFDYTMHDWRLIQIIISVLCGIILFGGIYVVTGDEGRKIRINI